jgi:hypothetical protein
MLGFLGDTSAKKIKPFNRVQGACSAPSPAVERGGTPNFADTRAAGFQLLTFDL